MKIVVLAGGLSPERNVSLSSGCKVCAALRERGHEAAFIDMYLGTQEAPGSLFSGPIPSELTKISRQAPDLEQVKAARQSGGDGQFGLECWTCAVWRTLCFWASTAPAARMERSRLRWTCWASPTLGPAIWAAPSPWIRT